MRFFSKLQFRTKINLGTSLIVALIALPLAFMVSRMAAKALVEETKKRGLVLSENLASRASDSMLAMDLLRLKNMVDELKGVQDNVYAFITDRDGNVLVHTFVQGFPVELLAANEVADGTAANIRLLFTGHDYIYDFAAPIMIVGARFGTARVGLSRTQTQIAVNKLIFYIFTLSGAALIPAMLISSVFARRVTRRIGVLRAHAEEVVKGNLDIRTGPVVAENCWEIMKCDLTHCPAYGDTRRRCWYLAGTLCPDCADPEIEDKEESCRNCPVYIRNKGDEIQDLAETFDAMALSLKSHLEELKRAEGVLSRQEQLMRTILDATPDFVCLVGDNLVYLAVNKAYAEHVGRPAKEIAGLTEFDLFPESEAKITREEDLRVLRTGLPFDREVRSKRGHRDMWLHVVRVPVFDKDGRVMGFLRTARDVTQLKLFQEQLIQSQKMESVGKLAGGVAHEINTPLGVILGYAQLLQEDVDKSSQIYEDLKIIEKQAKVCRKIVADLLGFSRQTGSTKLEMCFNNSLMEAISLVRHTFGLDKVYIMTDMDERMPIIYGDPEKLKQVWINLLTNARDAMLPGGGLLLVRSRLDSPGQKVTAWFADTGAGIDAENLQKIFDPFFTTKPVGQGTGLGLSVSFGIIEDHGGSITAKSPVPPGFFQKGTAVPNQGTGKGPGTVFVVDLPLDHEETLESEPSLDKGRT
ncbi:ATP-binding protein [Desulfolutivibrio sulfoxidireducens]|uniref:ATP-binding protein n=1 Tax=Desulfolutivibrio sulfoxidireducens TaxID=2773299 RepID=UPI00159EA74F|nr:ATP-binding protein [Desulfolutivibrio sulfoxidireducens]QLA18514.1 PAS domain-containing protein [Desulfolutivibrio sulfoxidireducens]